MLGIPCGPVIEELKQAVDYSSETEEAKIFNSLNLALRDIAASFSCHLLRRTVSIAAGAWLPADIAGVDAIYDSEYKYVPRERGQRNISGDDRRKYYISELCQSPLVHRRGISIEKGATSFTLKGTALDASYIGEYIRFAGGLGFYKLATITTIDTVFMGDKLINEWFQVRPEGTPKLGLCDEAGDDLVATVTLDYWTVPKPLTDKSQLIPLPSSEYLFLKTLARLLRFKENEGKAQSYTRDLQAAKEDMMAKNLRYVCPDFPEDSSGNTQGWGIETYE